MFLMKSVYCRVFQAAFRLAFPILLYREPEILHSCTELGKALEHEKVTSVLIITDKGIVNCGLLSSIEDVLKENNVPYQVGAEKFIDAIKTECRYGNPRINRRHKKEDIPPLAKHAEREPNPLYPVPKLMSRKELERFYYTIGGLHEKH